MSERGMRLGRGLAAAAVAVFMAAFSHVVGGGGAPGAVGLAVSLAFAAMLCVALTRRHPSTTLLVISVVISQFVFHLLFGVGDKGASGLTVTAVQHGAHSTTALIPDAAAGQLVTGQAAHVHDGGWMWVAHAFAAIVTIVAIRRGESVLRELVTLGRSRLWLPATAAVRRAALAVATGVSTMALLVRSDGAHSARRRRARTRALRHPSPMRDLGAVFDCLRHRGPPAALLARSTA